MIIHEKILPNLTIDQIWKFKECFYILAIRWNLLKKYGNSEKHSSKTGKLWPFFSRSSCTYSKIILQQQMGWWAQTVAKHDTWRMIILKESPWACCFLMATQTWGECRGSRVWAWSCLDWVWWVHVDSTNSIEVFDTQAFHKDVPFSSPTGAPGVFNYPVLETGASCIAHHKNPMIQVRPTATCEHTLQYTRRWKKELDRFWLIQSTECIILMYIAHRISDHVCVTANELLLTYPLILVLENKINRKANLANVAPSLRWALFLITYDLLQHRWSILLFMYEEPFLSVKRAHYEK